MKINEVIRNYRKKEGLTQEDLASYLNISIPAISKWETGIAYPDITLLPQLARILKIDINTLLSFNETLTDEQINKKIEKLNRIKEKSDFELVFQEGIKMIKEHPNSDKLIFNVIRKLNCFLAVSKVEEKDVYEKKIVKFYTLIIDSKEANIALETKHALICLYRKRKEYEKAQEILNKIPSINLNKELQQILIYEGSNKKKEAYKTCQNILLKNISEVIVSLEYIIKIYCSENKFDEADIYNECANKIIEACDFGLPNKYWINLCLASGKKDKEMAIEVVKKLVNEDRYDFSNSKLYSYLEFGERADIDYKGILKESLNNRKELDFIKEDFRFKCLIK